MNSTIVQSRRKQTSTIITIILLIFTIAIILHEASDFETLNCFSIREANGYPPSYHNKHNCSNIYKVACPIDQQFLADSIRRSKSISPFSPLCFIRDQLYDKAQVINVYIIGGSVTGLIIYIDIYTLLFICYFK